MFPILTELLRLLELGRTFSFSSRGKEHSKEESKNWRRRSGKWKMENFETQKNVSICMSVAVSVI